MTQRLAFIGFGGVGQALVDILIKQQKQLEEDYGFNAKVVAVSDMIKGAVYHPEGLDLEHLLQIVKETGSVENYRDTPGLQKGWDSFKTIKESNADTIIEVTYTNVETGQPAIDHHKIAFSHGKHVVTTNKGPIALAYKELKKLANEHNAFWGYEGTVMSGTPSIRMPKVSLAGNEINEIRGILNGTTNYILTEMENGLSYDDALKQAQSLGYAEANPTSDVEGYDARYKTVILANVIMNTPLTVKDVDCYGITNLTPEDIHNAKGEGMRWKLLSTIKKEGDNIVATVKPEKIPETDQLAAVTGPINAITYDCGLAGPITLIGAGAGLKETGFSLLIDLINFHFDKKLVSI